MDKVLFLALTLLAVSTGVKCQSGIECGKCQFESDSEDLILNLYCETSQQKFQSLYLVNSNPATTIKDEFSSTTCQHIESENMNIKCQCLGLRARVDLSPTAEIQVCALHEDNSTKNKSVVPQCINYTSQQLWSISLQEANMTVPNEEMDNTTTTYTQPQADIVTALTAVSALLGVAVVLLTISLVVALCWRTQTRQNTKVLTGEAKVDTTFEELVDNVHDSTQDTTQVYQTPQ